MKEFGKRINLLNTNEIRELNVIIREKQINSVQSITEFRIQIKITERI